jgi:hypothetical protein
MHLRVAGQTRWVDLCHAALDGRDHDQGSRFSAPVTLGEAGLDEHGKPMFAGLAAA